MEVENTKMEWWQLIILIMVIGLLVEDVIAKVCNTIIKLRQDEEKNTDTKPDTRPFIVYESRQRGD